MHLVQFVDIGKCCCEIFDVAVVGGVAADVAVAVDVAANVVIMDSNLVQNVHDSMRLLVMIVDEELACVVVADD